MPLLHGPEQNGPNIPPSTHYEVGYNNINPDRQVGSATKITDLRPLNVRDLKTPMIGVDGGSLFDTTDHVSLTPKQLIHTGVSGLLVQKLNNDVVFYPTLEAECTIRMNEQEGTISLDNGDPSNTYTFDPRIHRDCIFALLPPPESVE